MKRLLTTISILCLVALCGCGATAQQLDALADATEQAQPTVDDAAALIEATSAQIAEAEVRSQELLAQLALAQAEAAALAGQTVTPQAPTALPAQVITKTITKTVKDGSLTAEQELAVLTERSKLQNQLSAQRAAVMSADEGLVRAQAIIDTLRAANSTPITERYGIQGIIGLVLAAFSYFIGAYRARKKA
jgi:hypothetical protein